MNLLSRLRVTITAVPFTLAHPAAVLPLRRRGLVFSALVVGSMAPDFEYFFGLKRPISHTMPGILTFTLPLALAVLIIFHVIVKWPAIWLLPHGLQARVIGPARRFRWFPVTRLFQILVSLVIGLATHILWDGFTHSDGWAAAYWPQLRHVVSVPQYHPMRLFAALQLFCSVIGVLVLALSLVRWYLRTVPEPVAMRPQFAPAIRWSILIAMIVTATALGYTNGSEWYGSLVGGSHRARFVIGFTLTAISVTALEIVGFGLLWRMILARSPRQLATVIDDSR